MQEYKIYLTFSNILHIILCVITFGFTAYAVYHLSSVKIPIILKFLCAISMGYLTSEAFIYRIESFKKNPFEPENTQSNNIPVQVIGEKVYTEDEQEIGVCDGFYVNRDSIRAMINCGKESKLMDLSQLWFKDYEYYEEDEEDEYED